MTPTPDLAYGLFDDEDRVTRVGHFWLSELEAYRDPLGSRLHRLSTFTPRMPLFEYASQRPAYRNHHPLPLMAGSHPPPQQKNPEHPYSGFRITIRNRYLFFSISARIYASMSPPKSLASPRRAFSEYFSRHALASLLGNLSGTALKDRNTRTLTKLAGGKSYAITPVETLRALG
ncbi:Protein of unknown function [Thiocapsa roseopersicina]|uniref:Uncharacterized protein n=1 Tax=Thiocapsa roseopersicina TaxID=1058 RepID=A0A1H3DNW0_THIRO|nr:Protein of unknown function [Thiocapsa roseopersicina]